MGPKMRVTERCTRNIGFQSSHGQKLRHVDRGIFDAGHAKIARLDVSYHQVKCKRPMSTRHMSTHRPPHEHATMTTRCWHAGATTGPLHVSGIVSGQGVAIGFGPHVFIDGAPEALHPMQARAPHHAATCSLVCTTFRPFPLPSGLRNARVPTSPRSIGFCVIWGCISSSSSSETGLLFCPNKQHYLLRQVVPST